MFTEKCQKVIVRIGNVVNAKNMSVMNPRHTQSSQLPVEQGMSISMIEQIIKANLEKNNNYILTQFSNILIETLKVVINKESSNILATYLEEIDNQFRALNSELQQLNQNLCRSNDKLDEIINIDTKMMNEFSNLRSSINNMKCMQIENNQCLKDVRTELYTYSKNVTSLTDKLELKNKDDHSSTHVSYVNVLKTGLEDKGVYVNKKPDYKRNVSSSPPKQTGQEIHTPSIYTNNQINNLVNENTNSSLNVVPVSSDFEKIFISRLQPETTEMQIRDYIYSKTASRISIRIFKCKTKYPNYASFCLSVPKDSFHFLLDKSLWPANMVLRPFYSSSNPVQIQNRTYSDNVNRNADDHHDIDNASLNSKSMRDELNTPTS